MLGFARVIGSLLPASRRAARELEKIKLVKETEAAYRAKMMTWGGALLVVGIALSLGLIFWERSRRARQAEETELRESNLVLEVELVRRWAGLTLGRVEVGSRVVVGQGATRTRIALKLGQQQLTTLTDGD